MKNKTKIFENLLFNCSSNLLIIAPFFAMLGGLIIYLIPFNLKFYTQWEKIRIVNRFQKTSL